VAPCVVHGFPDCNISDRFLSYVQRYDIIPQSSTTQPGIRGQFPEPSSGLYLLKKAKRANGRLIGDIVPLDQIRALADLVPRLGKKANSTLTKENSHSLSLEFRLNKYFNRETFLAMTL
jgi:hypothetical protein